MRSSISYVSFHRYPIVVIMRLFYFNPWQLRYFFLDPETAMSPHLEYAQWVPGLEEFDEVCFKYEAVSHIVAVFLFATKHPYFIIR